MPESHSSQKLVVAMAGYTKSGKTRLAHVLGMYTQWDVVELSDGIRGWLPDSHGRASASEILSTINDLRRQHGDDILARTAAPKIAAAQSPVVILAGLRGLADYAYLRQEFPRLQVIFVHVTTSLRHQYMRDDPDSLAKTDQDFLAVDMQAAAENITEVARLADYHVINEPGYPLTPYEQLRLIYERALATQAGLFSTGGGYTVAAGDALKRNPREYLASDLERYRILDHPEADFFHGNHFHEETEEVLSVTSGAVSSSLRRATLVEEEPVNITLLAGQAIVVRPGWSHLHVAVSPGTRATIRHWSLDPNRNDVMPDLILNTTDWRPIIPDPQNLEV
jgi:hypothetical protein